MLQNMNSTMQLAIHELENLGLPGGRLNCNEVNRATTDRIISETDRRIAAAELGLPEDTSWERISRIAEADSVASPKNYR